MRKRFYRIGETIEIGDNIVVTILGTRHGKVRLGIHAPADVPIRDVEGVDTSGDESLECSDN